MALIGQQAGVERTASDSTFDAGAWMLCTVSFATGWASVGVQPTTAMTTSVDRKQAGMSAAYPCGDSFESIALVYMTLRMAELSTIVR